MNPDCGDAFFSRVLGDNLNMGTARLLGGAGIIVIVLATLIKLL